MDGVELRIEPGGAPRSQSRDDTAKRLLGDPQPGGCGCAARPATGQFSDRAL